MLSGWALGNAERDAEKKRLYSEGTKYKQNKMLVSIDITLVGNVMVTDSRLHRTGLQLVG